jgi:hypothetical protein
MLGPIPLYKLYRFNETQDHVYCVHAACQYCHWQLAVNDKFMLGINKHENEGDTKN